MDVWKEVVGLNGYSLGLEIGFCLMLVKFRDAMVKCLDIKQRRNFVNGVNGGMNESTQVQINLLFDAKL